MITIAGVAAFDGFGPWQILALVGAYALAFLIKGVFGYGAVPPMILMGSLVMAPHHAVMLAGMVNLASQAFLLNDGRRSGDRAVAGRMLVFILPAMVLGVFAFRALPPDGLQVTVGVVLIAILLIERSSLRDRLVPVMDRNRGAFGAGAGVVAGLMSGVVGAGAMIFLSVYLRTLLAERMALRGTIILIVTVVLAGRMAMLGAVGMLGWSLALEAALLLPVAAICLGIARRFAVSMSNAVYFQAYWVFMLLAATLLVLRGLL